MARNEPGAVLKYDGAAILRDLQEYSDQELIELAASEVGDRKKMIAEEILRRRQQQRLAKWFGPKAALAGVISTIAALLVVFKRMFSRRRST